MSHIHYEADGTKVRKRDIVDDLKEMIDRYEFYDEEVHRLWKDYEEVEAENQRLRDTCIKLLLENMDHEWEQLVKDEATKRANTRKWRAR